MRSLVPEGSILPSSKWDPCTQLAGLEHVFSGRVAEPLAFIPGLASPEASGCLPIAEVDVADFCFLLCQKRVLKAEYMQSQIAR